MQTPGGNALVDRYYSEAPDIASRLTQPEDLKYAWSAIACCVRFIEEEEYELAVQKYREMFEKLSDRVVISNA